MLNEKPVSVNRKPGGFLSVVGITDNTLVKFHHTGSRTVPPSAERRRRAGVFHKKSFSKLSGKRLKSNLRRAWFAALISRFNFIS